MWQIARSPKDENYGKDRVNQAEGRRRAMIGKFGIGKLASYAVGHRISHVCRTADGRYLTVSVNYRLFAAQDQAQDDNAGAEAPSTEDRTPAFSEVDPSAIPPDPSRTPIRELDATQAEAMVRELLPTGNAVEVMLKQPHWTLAVIDDLKDVSLYPGRLMWVLGNGMPLRPDFQVFVEDKPVTTRLASKGRQHMDPCRVAAGAVTEDRVG